MGRVIDYDAVVAQHWGDERIREVFIDDGGLSEYHDPINGAKENRRVMGAIFDAWLQSVKAAAWDEAFREVRAIPHWYSPETKVGGFDLGTDGEEGAYEAVMEVLKANPYREANG